MNYFTMPAHVSTNKTAFIFDLDGTIADIRHRRALVTGAKKNFDLFDDLCVDDGLNVEVAMILKLLKQVKWKIYIFSGRSERVRVQTEDWLRKMMIRYDLLVMRPVGNYEPDDELKRKWLHSVINPKEIVAVFDDRQKVVDMWRAEGLVCFQVAKGDF